jgi:hypothetical protein
MYDSAHVRRLVVKLCREKEEIERVLKHMKGEYKKKALADAQRLISESIERLLVAG